MSDENQYPSFSEQAQNLTNTAFDIMKGMMRGDTPMASPVVIQERQDICETCPKNDGMGKCIACGCVLDWKIPWAMSDCPEGKWDVDEATFKKTFQKRLDNTTKNSQTTFVWVGDEAIAS